uniref:Uncharacterized protein n=1 Tax=Plectus sambesii TaxID=2011161 RepID=A0A914US18_9BILA
MSASTTLHKPYKAPTPPRFSIDHLLNPGPAKSPPPSPKSPVSKSPTSPASVELDSPVKAPTATYPARSLPSGVLSALDLSPRSMAFATSSSSSTAADMRPGMSMGDPFPPFSAWLAYGTPMPFDQSFLLAQRAGKKEWQCLCVSWWWWWWGKGGLFWRRICCALSHLSGDNAVPGACANGLMVKRAVSGETVTTVRR